jgi:hypothetical protein
MQSTVHMVRSISSSDGGEGSSVAYVDKYDDNCENSPDSLTGSGFLAGRIGVSRNGMGEIQGNNRPKGENDLGKSPLTKRVTRIWTIYHEEKKAGWGVRVSSLSEFHLPCPRRERTGRP